MRSDRYLEVCDERLLEAVDATMERIFRFPDEFPLEGVPRRHRPSSKVVDPLAGALMERLGDEASPPPGPSPPSRTVESGIMNDACVTIPIGRLGVCSWSLQPKTAAELVESVARLGVPKIQLALGPVIDDSAAFGDVMPRLRDAGVRIASGMLEAVGEDYSTLETIKATGGVRPDEHWPATLDRARAVAALAAAESLPLVTLHAGFIPHEASDPARAVVLDRLRTLADVFADHGVRVGLETGQETAATLLDALAELGHENVGVNFDPANMILYGMGDPVDAIRLLSDHVVQVHAKDATPTETPGTWGSEVPLGTGAVDWNRFLEEVATLDESIDVVIEREAGDARETDILAARRRLTGS